MFTRSTSTPGTDRISANGSREVGILVSSSDVKFVDVPVAFGVDYRRLAAHVNRFCDRRDLQR